MSTGLYLPILKGRLRGKKWLVSAGGKIARLVLSTYEPEQTALFERLIAPGKVVFDVGAHAGYYTLLSSVLVGPEGRVFAFEPDPANHGHLVRHVDLNRAGNVTVQECAVSDENGTACFEAGSGSGTGHLSASGPIRVRMRRLDDFAAESGVRPDFMKIDTEGAELMVLRGAGELLVSGGPVIFLSTHGDRVHNECCDYLRGLGYRLEPILGDDLGTTRELVCYPK